FAPKYTPELAAEICALIARGVSVNRIRNEKLLPVSDFSIYEWIRTKPEFKDMYFRAKQEAADMMVEEMLDIVDDHSWLKLPKESQSAAIQHMRVKLDARKWLAMKLQPLRYGEKLELSGNKEQPLVINMNYAGRADGTKGN